MVTPALSEVWREKQQAVGAQGGKSPEYLSDQGKPGCRNTVLRQRVVTREVRLERRAYFLRASEVRVKNFGCYKRSWQPLEGFKQESVVI